MSVPITFLKGVKTIRAAQLAKLGVYTVEDLYELYPKSYEDRSIVLKICQLLRRISSKGRNKFSSIFRAGIYEAKNTAQVFFVCA